MLTGRLQLGSPAALEVEGEDAGILPQAESRMMSATPSNDNFAAPITKLKRPLNTWSYASRLLGDGQ
jgi:hypothetical protein